jgi:methionyl-tRNA synthetase
MSQLPIFLGVAWPYANGEQHIGHIAGAYLPADVFARFQRLSGRCVLMVSGSDSHGTPITIRAEQEGITPAEVVERYHPRFILAYQRLGITFDLFTHTDTQNHWDITHQFFLRHQEQGYMYRESQPQIYDPKADQFLPDRFVEGTCPKCGYTEARGDQCDNCGATYEATELLNPRSKRTGNSDLEVRESEHFFFDLGKLNDPLFEWIEQPTHEHWRPNVLNFTRSQLAEKKLRGRAITRDMSWGITIPMDGFPEKRIYVWYDAVIGYYSAAREWATLSGLPDAWKHWWENPEGRSYYFIGKDNIPFHTIIWPGMLLAHGGLNLPYDVPSNEYLNVAGRKISKSAPGTKILINDVLERYQPDAWRYALTVLAPEGNDVDFTWDDFVDRINGELVANWGNLINRMTSFAYKRFEGRIPTPGALTEADNALLSQIRGGFDSVGSLFEAVRLRAAASELARLSSLCNNYITAEAPFKVVKTDPDRAATQVWVVLQAIDWLKVLWAPILPHTSQLVHKILGHSGTLFGRQFTEEVSDARGKHLVLRYDHTGGIGKWEPAPLPAGQTMTEPQAPFVKLEPDTAEREIATK